MVEDSKYVIVPNNTADYGNHAFSNSAGSEVAKLLTEGWEFKASWSNRDSVHHLLVKFKNEEGK